MYFYYGPQAFVHEKYRIEPILVYSALEVSLILIFQE